MGKNSDAIVFTRGTIALLCDAPKILAISGKPAGKAVGMS
jgi:hypothetical protein